jgi:hypothetical protein
VCACARRAEAWKCLSILVALCYIAFVGIDLANIFLAPKGAKSALQSHASELAAACPLPPACPHEPCDLIKTARHSTPDQPRENTGGNGTYPAKEEPRNMILGLVTNNIDLERVVRFLRSCRKVVPLSTDIVFLTDYKSTGARAEVYEAMRVTEHVFKKGEERGYHFNMGRCVLLVLFVYVVFVYVVYVCTSLLVEMRRKRVGK